MGEVVRAVSDATHHEAVLVTDVGQNQMISARYFKYTKERSIITSGGLGTMGFGLPAAIGGNFRSTGTYRMRIYGRWRTANEYSGTGYDYGAEGSGEDYLPEQ